MRAKLNTRLYSLYTSCLNSPSITGIPALLGSFLCVLISAYIVQAAFGADSAVITEVIRVFTDTTYWPIFTLTGFFDLNIEEVEDHIDIAIKYIRVSSEPQDDQHGKERQNSSLEPVIENLNTNKVIEISKDWESAATMLRANIDEIINIAKRHPDQTVCLMIEDFDRLSRANICEAATFLWIMTQYDVLFYFDSMGYFDFNDPDQQLMALFGMYQARQEYNKITERTDKGQLDEKKGGGFPAQAPFGFTKRDEDDDVDDDVDNKLYLDEEEASVIRKAASELLNTDRSFSDVYNDLEDEHETSDVNLISKQQLKSKFTDPKYVGKLIHNGEHVGHCPQILSEEQFEELSNRFGSDKTSSENEQLDHALTSVVDRFGIDASLELFDVIKGRCPDCGGDVETWGSEERWGHRVVRYRCVNEQHPDSGEDENGCGFQGPLLTGEFLRKFQSTVPILCPLCQTPTNDDEWKSDPAAIDAIQQTCDECGLSFSLSASDDCVERGFEFPEYAIDLLGAKEDDDENVSHDDTERDHNGQDDVAQTEGSQETGRSAQQKGLPDFR